MPCITSITVRIRNKFHLLMPSKRKKFFFQFRNKMFFFLHYVVIKRTEKVIENEQVKRTSSNTWHWNQCELFFAINFMFKIFLLPFTENYSVNLIHVDSEIGLIFEDDFFENIENCFWKCSLSKICFFVWVSTSNSLDNRESKVSAVM